MRGSGRCDTCDTCDSIQILTTNIKGGLAVAAKTALLKRLQSLSMPLIPVRLPHPNWWFESPVRNTYFLMCLVSVDNYSNLINLQDVDVRFALICPPCAHVSCSPRRCLAAKGHKPLPQHPIFYLHCQFSLSSSVPHLSYARLTSTFLFRHPQRTLCYQTVLFHINFAPFKAQLIQHGDEVICHDQSHTALRCGPQRNSRIFENCDGSLM